MIYTGIQAIDQMIGGISCGSRVLFSLEPGIEGQVFMLNALYTSLQRGERCLVIVPYTTADVFFEDAVSTGPYSLDLFQDSIVVLDAHHRDAIEGPLDYTAEKGMAAWKDIVEKACVDNAIDAIFIYFNLFFDNFGFDAGLDIFDISNNGCNPTLILEYLNLSGKKHIDQIVGQCDFDLVISLNAGFTYLPFFNFFSIERVSWTDIAFSSIPYIISEGRIVPSIPKIVVTGPPDAGKSTFVRNASEQGMSVDRKGINGDLTTVALDIGHLRSRGFDITIYGTPGQERFDPIIPQLTSHAMGVILVIDVTKPDQMERARQLMSKIQVQLLPMIVAANKSDLPHALTEEEIRKQLGIKPSVPLYFISALKPDDARRVVESLIEFICRFPY